MQWPGWQSHPGAPSRSEGGDERWLITYADMITLLLVLFIILYSMANTDLEKFQAMAESLKEGFGATAGSTVNTGAEGGSGGSPVFPEGGASPLELFPEAQTPISIFQFAEMLEGIAEGDTQLSVGSQGGNQGDRNAGDQGDRNLGDQGDAGIGDQGQQANLGDQGDQGLGDQGERNLGDVAAGDQGAGDQGPRNLGDQGDAGLGDMADRGLGDQGAAGLGDEGPRGISDAGAAGGEEAAGSLRQRLRGLVDRAMAAAGEAGMDIADMPASISIEYDERGIRITATPTELFFESGSARLKPAGREFLEMLAPFLNRLPNRIEIQGHTDSVPINTQVYPSNWELSAGRAGSVIRHLLNLGLSADRLQAAGYADTMPKDTNATRDGRSRNRRVEILVLRDDHEEWSQWLEQR